MDANAPTMPDVLKNFITDPIWQGVKALETINVFANLSQSLE